MARKCYKPEEIVPLLRQAEVLHGHNHTSSRCRQRWLRAPATKINPRKYTRFRGLLIPPTERV